MIKLLYNINQYSTDIPTVVMRCNIIDRCNYSCSYCFNYFPRTNLMLNLDILYEFINRNFNDSKCKIILYGGEPSLHPLLLEFCKHIISNNKEIIVITNFSYDYSYYLKLLSIGVKLNISWHSLPNNLMNTQLLDKIFKLPFHIFENNQILITIMYEQMHTVNAINVFNLLKSNYLNYIEISKVFAPHYKYDVLYEYNTSLEIAFTDITLFSMKNRTINTFDMYRIIESGNNKIYDIEDVINKKLNNFHNYICLSGKDEYYIHYNGDISTCEDVYFRLNKKLGNIYTNIFKPLKTNICPLYECSCPYFSKKTKIFKTR